MLNWLKWMGTEDPLTPVEMALAGVPFFSELTTAERGLLGDIALERTYVMNEVIFDEEEEGVAMYLVVDGRVSIYRKGLMGKKEIYQATKGDFFGELALLDGFPRSAGATAAEPSTLLCFSRPDFIHLLEEHPRFGLKLSLQLARHIASKLRNNTGKEPEAV